jgi:hypothetical protein
MLYWMLKKTKCEGVITSNNRFRFQYKVVKGRRMWEKAWPVERTSFLFCIQEPAVVYRSPIHFISNVTQSKSIAYEKVRGTCMCNVYSWIFIFFCFSSLFPLLYMCVPINNSVIPCVCREWGGSVSRLDETLAWKYSLIRRPEVQPRAGLDLAEPLTIWRCETDQSV